MQAQQQALQLFISKPQTWVPEVIAQELTARGFKPNPSGLAEATGLPINTAYRLCREGHQHRALRQVNRVSQALKWSFDDLFRLATTHHSSKVAEIIRDRIKELGMTKREFSRKVFLNEEYKAGQTNYTTGRVTYEHLKTYATICSVLEISPELLAKALLRIQHLYKCKQIGKLTESEARHLSLKLNAA